MKAIRNTMTLLAIAFASVTTTQAQDPLPSWNDGPNKQAIVDFVKATTTTGGANFVSPAERIATFDQDGTLWVEHPVYSQLMYCLDARRPARQSKAGTGESRAVQDGASPATAPPSRNSRQRT